MCDLGEQVGVQGGEAEEDGGGGCSWEMLCHKGLRAWILEYRRSDCTSWLISWVTWGKLLNLSEPSVSKSVKWG